ncbi:MAG: 3-deoxy-D-manno-octulosonic acid transferase, partial [Xanthobacteraceae bacterium]
RIDDEAALAVRLGAWLNDAAARKSVADAAAKTVGRLGGALKRTLVALDPYLLQLRLEQRAC